jgi:hypothetical protein
MRDPLQEILQEELQRPVSDTATAAAAAVRDRHRRAAVAVLFYGSCLRKPDVELADNLLDFYVLVDRYGAAYDKAWLALANRLLPPNAFYLELPWRGGRLRAKYVVISLDDFERGCSAAASNVSIWARFAQPARLVWSRDAATDDRVVRACASAVRTMLRRAWPLQPESRDAGVLWPRGFRETYAAELRPEGSDRGQQILDADPERYRRLTQLVLAELDHPEMSIAEANRYWRQRRRIGKALNLARIVKAAFTFDGGLDYVLWKIRRHSGVTIPVTDWQRRHPLLAAPALAWRLYRLGAFR